jgi:hypothetical protein
MSCVAGGARLIFFFALGACASLAGLEGGAALDAGSEDSMRGADALRVTDHDGGRSDAIADATVGDARSRDSASETDRQTAEDGSVISRFGVSLGGLFQSEDAATLDRDLDLLHAAHAGWLRFDINWAQIQAVNSTTYDWSLQDVVVAAANARGFQLLGDIV